MIDTKKWVLLLVGILVLAMGVIPLLKPYVPQLAVIPTEGVVYQIALIVLGIIAIGYSLRRSASDRLLYRNL